MPQSNSAFKTVFDTLTMPYQKPNVLMKELAKTSSLFSKWFKVKAPTEGNPIGGLPTFFGRSVKIPVNALYPVVYSKRTKFNIQHGDVKQPEGSKNVIYAEIDAVDKGFTMGITTSDLQLLENKGMEQYANWIKNYWADTMQGFSVSLLDSIYNGSGSSSVRWDGEVKPDFVGLSTIIGSGTYGGKTTSDFYEWQSVDLGKWDMTSNTTVLGRTVASEFDTIAHATSVATGQLVTPLYDVLQKALNQARRFSSNKNNFIISCHPAVYDYLWVPSLQATASVTKVMGGNNMPKDTDYVTFSSDNHYFINGAPVIAEEATLPNNEIGSAPSYIHPLNKIYILNLDALNLEVSKSNNFVMSDWEYIPNQFNAMQKTMSTTLLMYATKRYSMGVITLPTNLVSAVSTAYGL